MYVQGQSKLRRMLLRPMLLLALGGIAAGLAFAAPVHAAGPNELPPQQLSPAVTSGVARIIGIDDGGVFKGNPTALGLAAAVGAPLTRIELNWGVLEPQKGSYDFTLPDASLNPVLDAGMTPVVYLTGTPYWAGNQQGQTAQQHKGCGPIDTTIAANVDALENTMGVLAARYDRVPIWALYNEEDATGSDHAGCFGFTSKGGVNNNGVEDYKEYAIMLAAAWRGVHAHSSALLASGAVAYDSFDKAAGCAPNYPGNCDQGGFNYHFVPHLFKYMKNNVLPNGEKYMDMFLYNYYELYGTAYWQRYFNGRGIHAKATAIRQLMTDAGIPKVDLLVTETGESSSDQNIKSSGQARCVDTQVVRGAAAKLKGVVWWTFRDRPDPDTWKYGLVDQDLNPKPSYTAMETVVEQLNGYVFNKIMSNRSGFAGVEAYKFKSGTAVKYFVMSSALKPGGHPFDCAAPRYKKVAVVKAKRIEIVDYMGGARTLEDNAKKDKDKRVGYIGFKVGADPKFVRVNPPQ